MPTAPDPKQRELFTEAYRAHARELLRHAQFMIADRDRSEDLVQDVFLKTWLYILHGGEIKIIRSFLYHLLNNIIVDEYRKSKTASLDALLEEGYEPGIDESERMVDILDGKVAVALIDRLPPEYQEVLRMRYLRGLSLGEIAHMSGYSTNTLAVRVHRALYKLKSLYFELLGTRDQLVSS